MYNEHFGFLEPPFSAAPDSRIFYRNDIYQEAFANLRYGIEWKKGLIVLTGEVGTGKTTLLHKIVRSLEPTTQAVFVSYDQLDSTELVRLVSRELGLPADLKDRIELIEQFRLSLVDRYQKRHIAALLIDEAQNLSDETFEAIRFLSNFELGGEKLLQIVLTGQPELRTRLNDSKLRHLKQRVVIHCRLAPLKRDEVRRYIEFRLKEAGYHGKELFDSEALEWVTAYSGGTPRVINIICDNALLLAYAAGKKAVTGEMIHEVAGDLGLANHSTTEVTAAGGANDSAQPLSHVSIPGLHLAATQARGSKRGLAWVSVGISLALVAMGGAAATIYSQQIKGYLGQVTDADEHRDARHHGYQSRSVTYRASEPEILRLRPESLAHNTAPRENAPAESVKRPSTAPKTESSRAKESAAKKNTTDPRLGTFDIVGRSFVRRSPRSDATIVATLLPSGQVKVISARGDYLHVQAAVDGKTIRGYVHREDALFERPKSHAAQANMLNGSRKAN